MKTTIIKKISLYLSLVMIICTVLTSVSVTSFAAEPEIGIKTKLDTDVDPVDPLKDFIPPSIDFLCEETPVTRSATITVKITSPCDLAWRNTYPDNWMWQANRAIQNAETMLKSRYGIDYVSVSQKYWTSNNTTASALLAEVKSEWGLRDGADIMVAFTGRDLGNTMGIAYVNQGYCLISDHGYEYNSETVQHETGHCYGLSHCSANCVMTAYGMGHMNTICGTHNSQWSKAKNKY